MATKVKLIADGIVTADQLTLTTASTGTNTTAPATTAFVQQEVAALVDSSPDALNTLNELAAALGDDANFSTTVTNSIATKLPLAGGTMTGTLTLADITSSGYLQLTANDVDFIVRDTTDSPSNFIWRDHSASKLYLGTPAAEVTIRSDAIIDTGYKIAIGTDNPNANLHIGSSAATGDATNPALQIGGASTYRLGMYTGSEDAIIENKNGDDGIAFRVKTAGEAMRIDGGTGNVGIGTASPSYTLDVEDSNDGHLAEFRGAGTNAGGRSIRIGVGNTNVPELPTYQPYIYASASDSANNSLALVSEGGSSGAGGIDFYTGTVAAGTARRMRIDRAGNLLVGQQTASSGTVGTSLRADGRTFFCADGNYAAHFNRNTSNGAIVHFAKDDNIVGSISVVSDDRMVFSTADGLGLQFDKDNNRIVPCDAAGAYNNNVELGDSSLEFTNLYLSGTVNAATLNVTGGIISSGSNTGTNPAANGHIASELQFFNTSATDNNLNGIGFYNSNDLVDARIAGVHKSHSSRHGEIAFLTHNGSALTERMRIDSSGNVGMGSTNPNSALHVVGDTLGGILLKQSAQISYTPANEANFQQGITFENSGSGHAFSIGYGQGGVLKFSYFDNSTTYSELGQFNSQGDLNIKGSVIVPSGEGISFAANSNASGRTSELLDDYEEGTWTPTFVGATLSTATGFYTKIGNQVTVHFRVITTGGLPSSTTPVQVGGLPFTIGTNFGGVGGLYVGPSNVSSATGGGGTIVPYVTGGESFIRFLNVDTGTFGYTIMGELEVSANNVVTAIGTVTYQV